MVPGVARQLRAAGWSVAVESGAGAEADYADADYADAGVEVARDAAGCLAGAKAVVRVQALQAAEAELVPQGATVLSFLQPATSVDALVVLAGRGASVFSFERLPRISRAQSMDALSSQATVSGYRAVLTAATRLGRFFPMLMTAAGTVPPAKVLVIGAGVAGLQAIATARRLGAVVRAYDVRVAAREEAESLGATFADLGVTVEGAGGYARELSSDELAAQQRALADEVARADVVITTAAVPGRPAPVLVTTAMVEAMAPGTIVVDMVADSGGNCECTERGREILVAGTLVVGMANPPAGMPAHASALYARNVASIMVLLGPQGTGEPDWDDEIVTGSCVLREGRPVDAQVAEILGMPGMSAVAVGADEEPGGTR
jgi:H+-translocating NAD(P) transhydrogenase subunit alpha